MKILLNIFCITLFTASVFAQDNFSELDERLTNVELSLTDRKLYTTLELQMFGGKLNNDNVLGLDKKLNTEVFKNNLRIKINGKLNDDFSAYVSLQVSHTFNDEVQSSIATDNDILTPTHGSRPYLRTAYFDWKLLDKLVLSAGRLPTTFGPPEHHKAGRSRLGTYPLTSFNIPLDGISLTSNFYSSKNLEATSRTIYVPGAFNEPSAPQNGLSLSSSDKSTLAKGHEGFTQMLDLDFKRPTPFYDRANFILQYSYIDFGSFIERTGPADILSSQMPGTIDRNIYRIYADNPELAKIQIISTYLEALGFFNTKFDVYMSYMRSWNRPIAKIKAEVISDATGGTTSEGTVFDIGQFMASGNSQGTRAIYGLKYNFERSFISTEFWKTSSSPIPNDLYSDDPIALGQLSGEAIHLFYTHLFYNNNLSVRTGYIDIKTDKTFSTYAYEKRKQNIDFLYTSLFVTF